MKRTYAQPRLVEYGRLEQLTLGTGGTKPDYVFTGGGLVNTNTNCSDTSTNTTSCLVVS